MAAQRETSRGKIVFRTLLYLVIMLVVFFAPAGRLDWWEGWIFLSGFLGCTIFIAIWMRRYDPDLVKERTQRGENVKGWDNILMAFYTVLLLAMLVLASFDSGRFNWSPTSLAAKICGGIGLLFAFSLVWRVMAENTYLSERVRIQEERGHRVVSTGPYSVVRHPMYVGIIVAIICTPLVLDSWLALVPGVLIAVIFIIRTAMEDRTLQDELPGYREYAARVRYRLVPGIW